MSDNNDLSKSGDHPASPTHLTDPSHPVAPPVDDDTAEDNATLADTLQSLRDMGQPSAHGSPPADIDASPDGNPFDGMAEDDGVMEMMDFGENDFDQDTLANLAALSKFGPEGEEDADAEQEVDQGEGEVDFSMFLPPMEDEFEMPPEAAQTDVDAVEPQGEKKSEGSTAREEPTIDVTIEEELFNEPAEEGAGVSSREEQATAPAETTSQSAAPTSPPQPASPPREKDIGPLDIPEPPSQPAASSSKTPAPRSPSSQNQNRDETELRDVNEIGQESAYGTNGNAGDPRGGEEGMDDQGEVADDQGEDEDEEFMDLDPKYVYEDGRLKRKRNRTTL